MLCVFVPFGVAIASIRQVLDDRGIFRIYMRGGLRCCLRLVVYRQNVFSIFRARPVKIFFQFNAGVQNRMTASRIV